MQKRLEEFRDGEIIHRDKTRIKIKPAVLGNLQVLLNPSKCWDF
jgi:hypothetical protein